MLDQISKYAKYNFLVNLELTFWFSVNGRFAPGMAEIGAAFSAMWRDADENREKWGCALKLSLTTASNHTNKLI